ncbi:MULTISPECIES: nitrite reductase small subunit NirD [unclassified Rhodococcus (in: high G+C Gram-positive bacteria)]|uniref:nitrite reductase small subunit NirD n=1 Tax=unclassified Rhodococcus (in: high G+C Gram-positive bacteria) TaxID=192944 RepID=UPI000E0C13B2|nr:MULTISPECIES: nitrite reductase small subunit NirD [unclassified Rhodococcus (in: high G+C Gram-positive bacteria)]QKT12501.1 nitrite reductase small subunit NirD [Rhodococcus sp. W8901]RDI25809.1 nitrite reductase (NADH) small subunit [Rhodococcus sp. AG1013]
MTVMESWVSGTTDTHETAFVTEERHWTSACARGHLIPGRGVAVLLRGGAQAALFLLADGSLRAVGNIDPFGRAAVMSRGLVGDRGGEPTVASPLLKQVFSLNDGRCLDDDGVRLPVYPVRVVRGRGDDVVQVCVIPTREGSP